MPAPPALAWCSVRAPRALKTTGTQWFQPCIDAPPPDPTAAPRTSASSPTKPALTPFDRSADLTCLVVSPVGASRTISLSDLRLAGSLFIVQDERLGSEACRILKRPYPLSCTRYATRRTPGSGTVSLFLDRLDARVVTVTGDWGGLSMREARAHEFIADDARFTGCVSLRSTKLDVFSAAGAYFAAGLDLFALQTGGHADLGTSTIASSANLMLAEIGGTLQLAHVHLIDAPFVRGTTCPIPDNGHHWVLTAAKADSLHAPDVYANLKQTTIQADSMRLDGLDIRTTADSPELPRWNLEKSRISGGFAFSGANFEGQFRPGDQLRLQLGPLCTAPRSGGECQIDEKTGAYVNCVPNSPTRGKAYDLERLIHSSMPLATYAHIAGSNGDRSQQRYYQRRSAKGGMNGFWFALVGGMGQWTWQSYAILLLGLYGISLFVFWSPTGPAGWPVENRPPWRAVWWAYSAAVLLPAILDVGVAVRPSDRYWWSSGRQTALFHLLHILGWLTCTMLAIAISRAAS